MSIGSFFRKLLGSPAAHAAEEFVLTEVQKAVAVLKTTKLGAVVAADIQTVASRNISGAQKFEQVVTNTVPLIVTFLADNGAIKVAVQEVSDIARELVQSTYNDTKSTAAGTLATLILSLFGVKV